MVGLHKGKGRIDHEEGVGSKAIGIAISLAVILVIGFAFYYLYTSRAAKAVIDANTLCAKAGLTSVKAVLIDRTDPITVLQRELLRSHVQHWAKAVPVGGMFQVFEVGVGGDLLTPVITVCNPGDGSDANQLVANKAMLRNKYEQKYLKPINQMLEAMVSDQTASKSPIMEGVQAIAVRDFGEDGPKGSNSLIIVSDLLQNGQSLSLYRAIPDPTAFAETATGRSLHADLSGVEVSVYFIDRKKDAQFQTSQLGEFWLKWLALQGAEVDEFHHLPG